MRALALVVALVVVLAACSSASNPAQQVDTDTGDGEIGSSTTLDASETPDSTTIPVVEQSGLVLLTESGQGPRPLFSWQPAPEATRYAVTVMSESGETYWAGFTTETQLQMGDPTLPDDVMGPKIADGYSWVVYALDDAGRLLALSETRPISP